MVQQLLVKNARIRRALAWSSDRRVIETLLRRKHSMRYWTATELVATAGVRSGAIYPTLARLERVGVLERARPASDGAQAAYALNPTKWEQSQVELLLVICKGVLGSSRYKALDIAVAGMTMGDAISCACTFLEDLGIDAEGFLREEEFLE